MSDITEAKIFVTCPSCGQHNHVPIQNIEHAKCGKCTKPLIVSAISQPSTNTQKQLRNCMDCGGKGAGDCSLCGRSGQDRCPEYCNHGKVRSEHDYDHWVDCSVCRGLGTVHCNLCAGSGLIPGQCPTCKGCGQLSYEEFDDIVSRRESAESARRQRGYEKAEKKRIEELNKKRDEENAKLLFPIKSYKKSLAAIREIEQETEYRFQVPSHLTGDLEVTAAKILETPDIITEQISSEFATALKEIHSRVLALLSPQKNKLSNTLSEYDSRIKNAETQYATQLRDAKNALEVANTRAKSQLTDEERAQWKYRDDRRKSADYVTMTVLCLISAILYIPISNAFIKPENKAGLFLFYAVAIFFLNALIEHFLHDSITKFTSERKKKSSEDKYKKSIEINKTSYESALKNIEQNKQAIPQSVINERDIIKQKLSSINQIIYKATN